ncbi:class I SAM-dependent methyltransferase [Candidatus Poribacteria bacterium]|nr:class I SAM-dependent methyltransferase [Candidatus Poribacteria bacterium]
MASERKPDQGLIQRLSRKIYQVLEIPFIYDLSQEIFSIGRKRALKHIERLLAENARGRILDVGCGTGRYAHLFESNYYALDINPKYLAGKSQKRLQFVCGDVTLLPFKRETFDFVFSIVIFHHIDMESMKKALKEIASVCKSEAIVVIVDCMLPENVLDIPARIICKLDRGKCIKDRRTFEDALRVDFNFVDVHHVDYSYPYNFYAFTLRPKQGAAGVGTRG